MTPRPASVSRNETPASALSRVHKVLSAEEQKQLGEATPRALLEAIMASAEEASGQKMGAGALRFFAAQQRAIAEEADFEAAKLEARLSRLVEGVSELLKPVSVSSYFVEADQRHPGSAKRKKSLQIAEARSFRPERPTIVWSGSPM